MAVELAVESPPSDLAARLTPLRDACMAIWRDTPADLPPFGPPVGRLRQWGTARATARLIDELAGRIGTYPTGAPERHVWRRAVRARLQEFGEVRLGWPPAYRRLVLGEAFYDASVTFARLARTFDPTLSLEDLGQALRNVWIGNSLQILLGRPVRLTPGLFAYSMLYPATDNLLDDPSVPTSDKRAFNQRLSAWLIGERPAPDGAAEAGVLALVDRVADEFPRDRHPGLWASVLAIHRAQMASLRQQRNDSPDAAALLELSVAKGGASVLTDAYLVGGELAPADEQFGFCYGVFLQLLDDLQDVETDLAAGHHTLFTHAAGAGWLDDPTARLARFIDVVLDTQLRPMTALRADCADLVRRNCRALLVGVVAAHPHRFSRAFRRRMERQWPVTFLAMRRLRGRAARRLEATKAHVRRQHGLSSPLELLLDVPDASEAATA